MKVSEYRKIVDALARFASARAGISGPTGFIGVQHTDVLKLISGSEVACMVVEIPEASCDEGRYSYCIDARPLLESSKVLPAKDTLEIKSTPEALIIIASGGGRLELKAVGKLSDAGFPRRPSQHVATAFLLAKHFGQVSRLFTSISEKVEVPSVNILIDKANLVAVSSGMRARYARLEVNGTGPDGYSAAGYLEFWDSLRVMETDGELRLGKAGVLASSGRYTAFSAPYLVSRYDQSTKESSEPAEPPAWPVMSFRGSDAVSFGIGRNELISALRAQSPNDEHKRVTFEVSDGFVLVTPFGNETGLRLPARTSSTGSRSVNAEYLKSTLSAMTDCKDVTITWGNPAPAINIAAEGYEGWTILCAPVVFK